jgi:hypothetical protein
MRAWAGRYITVMAGRSASKRRVNALSYPAINLLAKRMDLRVNPAGDGRRVD